MVNLLIVYYKKNFVINKNYFLFKMIIITLYDFYNIKIIIKN